MRRMQGFWSSFAVLFFLLMLALVFTYEPRTICAQDAASVRGADDANSDVAHWKNGELVPPLPTDPVKRAEAIRLAKERGRLRDSSQAPAPAEGVLPVRGIVEPQKVGTPAYGRVSSSKSRPSSPQVPRLLEPVLEPFIPTAEQLREAARVREIIIDPAMIPASPGLMGSFEAVDYTGWTPPSPDIAAGPDHILVATNDEFAVYDKCGNWISGGDFGTYFGISSAYTMYDAHVVYDDWDNRWVMAYTAIDQVGDQSRICVAISVSANLEDGWSCHYTISFANTGNFIDNMYMSVDPEGIYFTFNEYDFITYGFEGASITILEKPAVYNCSAAQTVGFHSLINPGDASSAFAVRPAQMHSYVGRMYYLNNKFQGGTVFTRWYTQDPFSAPVLSSAPITTTAYTTPPPMRQPDGTYVRAGDCRLSDLVYYDGVLITVFCEYRDQSGTPLSKLNLWNFNASSATQEDAYAFSINNHYMSYPSLEVDEYGRLAIFYTNCSLMNSTYLSTRYFIWDWRNPAFVDTGPVADGLANFTLGGSGTSGNPYRWGAYTGCAIDPVDDRTFWLCGAYASDDPTPSWATRVGAVSGFATSNLTFSPGVSVTGGVPGGPFTQETLPVTLSNTGGAGLNWRIVSFPEWITPSAMTGQIPPVSSQMISLFLNEDARELSTGVYNGFVSFENCMGTVSGSCSVTLTIVEPIVCPAAAISLAPEVGDAIALYGSDEYSLFVTAIEDIDVCAMGLMLAHAEPVDLSCYVYEADGTVRGALVSSSTQIAVQDAGGSYLVPMDITLQACQDYEIMFTHPNSIAHASYDESEFSYPFDANGIIRVRQSATNGSIGDTQHPGIVLFGYASCDAVMGQTTDLYRDETEHTESSTNSTIGLFITARDNLNLCSVGFEADLVRDRWLSARVYEATGNVRGPLVAQGFLPVQAGGLAGHEVPVHALLRYGQDYNISLDISETGYWPAVAEAQVSLPYDVDGVIDVRRSELNGSASTNIPHLWLNWGGVATRGASFDLAKSADGIPAPYTASGNVDHGAFVQPAATQNIYSVGVLADIPEGMLVIARVYTVTPRYTRGALQTQGWIQSGGPGMRWHDIPVALTWQAGMRYDVSIVCSNVTELEYWLDTSGMPYSPYGGAIQVLDAETAGDPVGTDLIHLRINACDEIMTAIGDGDEPPAFIPLSLEAPVPNPANGLIRFGYSVDAPGKADLEIYDVMGRRVAPVFIGRKVEAGPGSVEFDASGLQSGVYFLRLNAGTKAVARKITVMR